MTFGPTIPRGGADWSVVVESREAEHPDPVALVAEGDVPPGLAGTLYLGGPARHDVYGSRGSSWLDGDGMVHAVRLGPGGARYQSRFVATEKKAAEDRAGRRLYATFASPAPGGRLARLARGRPRSTANGGVLVHRGRLFALWDGAPPYELDPRTLETLGRCRLGGALGRGDGFGSFPGTDPENGEVWNVGRRLRGRLRAGVYRWPARGPARLVASAPLPYRTVLRPFGLSATRAVFVLSPLVPDVSAAALLGQRPIAGTLAWRPELGSVFGVVDRATGSVRFVTAPAMVVSAVAQAFDDGDDLVVDLCSYPNQTVLSATADMMQGRMTATGYATLERVRIGAGDAVERTLLPPLDWPAVAPGRAGPAARVYGINLNPVVGFPGTLVSVDTATGKASWERPAPDALAGPPVAVARGEGDGDWVLTVVTDLAARRSELRVLDGERIGSPPVYRAELPAIVPFGARGAWAGERPG